MTTRTLTLSLLLLLVVSSAASAGWGAMGKYEPDTRADVTAGWLFLTPETSSDQSVNKVYFSGFYGQCVDEVMCSALNPNAGTLHSAVHTTEYVQLALLGVWKDCNRDGFVGLGDQGLFEYRSTLLTDTSVCPPQPPAPTDKYGKVLNNWFPNHNDGTWVREFLPIQWTDMLSATCDPLGNGCDHNPWNINDNGARVWADHGLEPDYGVYCYYVSYPVGTFRSTGGLLHTFDCFDSYGATDAFDRVADSTPQTQPFSFSDAPRDQAHSRSMLNQPNPWGQESDASDAQVWDCSKPTTHVATVSVAEQVNVSQPKVPPSVSTGGSLAGTANATGSGFDQCNRNTQNNQDTHWGDTLAGAPYSREVSTSETPYRTQADDNFAPIEQSRPAAPLASVPGWGKSAPADAGLRWTTADCFVVTCGTGMDGVWEGSRIYHQETVFTGPGGARPVRWETYYAYVDPAAVTQYGLQLPKGSLTGTYGVEACGSATAGIQNNWDCNAADWYKDANGADIAPRSPYLGPDPNAPPGTPPCSDYSQQYGPQGCVSYGALPGNSYDLKDVDCYDQSVEASAAGVGVGRDDPTVGTPQGPETLPGVGWGLLTDTSCG